MSGVKRYRFHFDKFANCSCDLKDDEQGGYVKYSDYQALEEKVKELESLLRMTAFCAITTAWQRESNNSEKHYYKRAMNKIEQALQTKDQEDKSG